MPIAPRCLRVAAAGVVAAAVGLVPLVPAVASAHTDTVEFRVLELINRGRATVGKGAEVMHAGLRTAAQQHSVYQSSNGMSHNGLQGRINGAAPAPAESNGAPDDGFRGYCENVAYFYPGTAGATDEQVAQKFYSLWYNSASHKRCMFDESGGGFNVAGVGVHLDSRGYWWATFDSVRDLTPPATSGPPPPPPSDWTRVDQNASAVSYLGTWSTVSTSRASGGNLRRSTTTGSTAKYSFNGTGVRWIGARSEKAGIADVRIDGLLVATVDQYATRASYQAVMFERSGLAPGPHTLEIGVRGTRNPKATDVRTFVDAFENRS